MVLAQKHGIKPQWKETENPNRNTHNYSHLVVDKRGQKRYTGEKMAFFVKY